jgi:predicted DNA-binding protein
MEKRRRKPSSYERLRKTQMALYLEPEQASALAALSERTRVPKQVYLREGLDLILAKYSKEA